MKPISDGWNHHRATSFPRYTLDARARAEIERAFYAGAEHVVDALVEMNDAGLTLPFVFARQLQLWNSETASHDNRLTREETP